MKRDRFTWIRSVRTTWANKAKCIALIFRRNKAKETRAPRKPTRLSWVYKSSALLIALSLISGQAHGQFGIDIAAILAALSQMQSLMSTYIAAPLKTINQAQQSMMSYEQQVIRRLRLREGMHENAVRTLAQQHLRLVERRDENKFKRSEKNK